MSTSSNSPPAPSLRRGIEILEDRITPVYLSRVGPQSVNFSIGTPAQVVPVPTGGASIAVADIIPEGLFNVSRNEYITGTGPGREGLVRIFNNNGGLINQFVPFVGFTGGINVAAGDVLNDGAAEIIVSIAANGPPLVKVFSPSGTLLSAFVAFTDAFGNPSYLGGLNIAVGNVLNEGPGSPDQGVGTGGFFGGGSGTSKAEIIVGSAGGGIQGHVKAFDGGGKEFRSFFPFAGGFFGGVSVAASSIDSTRTPGSGGGGPGGGGGGPGGGGPGGGGAPVRDTNSYSEIIVGATSAAPHVKVFSVWQSQAVQELQSYYAFDPSLGRGITVAAGSTDGFGNNGSNRGAEIYAALIGDSTIGAPIRIYNGENGVLRGQFMAFPPTYSRVVNIAIGNVTGSFDPQDNGNNTSFFRDLSIVAGDGPYEQVPRVFRGAEGSPAGLNGP